MTFKSIGDLAVGVLAKAERSAARRALRLEAARPRMGEDEPPVAPQDVAPRLSGVERHDASNTNENAGVPIGEATPASEGQRQREEYRRLSYDPRKGTALPGGKLLKLVTVNDARGHPPMLYASSPTRSPRVSLSVVGGKDHCTGSLSRAGALDFRDLAR